MKKNTLLLFLLSSLCITSCNTNEEIENNNSTSKSTEDINTSSSIIDTSSTSSSPIEDEDKDIVTETNSVLSYVPFNTTQIMKNDPVPNSFEKVLTFNVARGERETSQLVLNQKVEEEISYDLEFTDFNSRVDSPAASKPTVRNKQAMRRIGSGGRRSRILQVRFRSVLSRSSSISSGTKTVKTSEYSSVSLPAPFPQISLQNSEYFLSADMFFKRFLLM